MYSTLPDAKAKVPLHPETSSTTSDDLPEEEVAVVADSPPVGPAHVMLMLIRWQRHPQITLGGVKKYNHGRGFTH